MIKPRIVIGSDHGGFDLKENLRHFLTEEGYQVQDFGCHSKDAVDYPDIAFLVATTVASSNNTMGIMIDTLGVASSMVCNKVPGVLAACCWSETTAWSSRNHNNANVLTLGGGIMGPFLAQRIVKTWLDTKYAGGRHERRVQKIHDVESRFLKR